jgi:outer membrane protein W
MNRIFLFAFIAVILMSSRAYAAGERYSVDISFLGGNKYKVSGLYSGDKPVGHYTDPNIEFGNPVGLSVGTDFYLNDNTSLRADISLLDAYAREDYVFKTFAAIQSSRSRKVPVFIGARFRDASSDREIYLEVGPEYTYVENKVEYVTSFDVWDYSGGASTVNEIRTRDEDEEKNEYFGGALGVGMKFYIYKRMYIAVGFRQHFFKPYNYYNGSISIGFRIY